MSILSLNVIPNQFGKAERRFGIQRLSAAIAAHNNNLVLLRKAYALDSKSRSLTLTAWNDVRKI